MTLCFPGTPQQCKQMCTGGGTSPGVPSGLSGLPDTAAPWSEYHFRYTSHALGVALRRVLISLPTQNAKARAISGRPPRGPTAAASSFAKGAHFFPSGSSAPKNNSYRLGRRWVACAVMVVQPSASRSFANSRRTMRHTRCWHNLDLLGWIPQRSQEAFAHKAVITGHGCRCTCRWHRSQHCGRLSKLQCCA